MRLRVLMYSRVQPADGGGVQAVYSRLAADLRARGHRVVKAWSVPNPDQAARDQTYALPLLVWRHGLPAPRSLFDACRATVRLALGLARFRPHIVNYHYVTSEAMYFLLLRPIFRYQLVLSVHGSDVQRPKPWDAPHLGRLLGSADAITAVSARTAAHVTEHGVDPDRVSIVPNGVDCRFWSEARGTIPVVDRPPVVLSVGRLHPVKAQDVLLRAFAIVGRHVRGARLVIVGDGGMREDLERLSGELNVIGAVEFAGKLDPEDVRERLGRARVFVLPSRSEGLPMALLEAMCAGVPPVATRVGGVPEVLLPGTGIMVEPEDPAAMAEALTRLLDDRELAARVSAAAMERASAFSSVTTYGRYEARFLEVAAGHRPLARQSSPLSP